MYNVMLVDDDYPVLELLSETIQWERLGLRLMGTHENGWNAWEHAQREMPDILITDIGMPKMDGLELSEKIRGIRPNVRIAILSCHHEFDYALKAMRLRVQDYLLKDTLVPEDLAALLARFKESIEQEHQIGWEQTRMRHLAAETRELRKVQKFKLFIDQPLLFPGQWTGELQEYGLFTEGRSCLPVVGHLEDYSSVKQRFTSDETLHFAVSNVMNEAMENLAPRGVHIGYKARTSLLLFSYRPGLQTNVYEAASAALREIGATLNRVLKVRMSFILGQGCASPVELKASLGELLGEERQRFYLEPGTIAKREKPLSVPPGGPPNLFAEYGRASQELREVLLGSRPCRATEVAEAWIGRIRERRYPPEMVKDWTLKLLLDLKLKLHSLQAVRPSYSADTLHKELMDIASLAELRQWLIHHLTGIAGLKNAGSGMSKRPEVAEACRYVSLRLHARICLDEVAEHLHLNPSYFSRLFKKETGMTFIEYVTSMKMERAKELLDATNHTVGEICERLGYDNQSYFIKTFKSYAGMTPAEYRG